MPDITAETLIGERIVLRRAKEKDALSMLRNVWGDEAVYRWMLYRPTLTEEEAADRCRRSIRYQEDHYAWFVALKDTDEAVGLCAITEKEPGHFEESGICIGRKYQGRGYGKEIVSLLLALAFEHLGALDVRYGYFEDNLRSGKLAEKFGFVFDRTYELTRPWDGQVKTVRSCILTRENYLARQGDRSARHTEDVL
ncbi:MAG: GNAT family N-acetyltransferase [Clostridia bacterium]|nr:GNAT family N-acetyltransferase [Clostridia bacterium]